MHRLAPTIRLVPRQSPSRGVQTHQLRQQSKWVAKSPTASRPHLGHTLHTNVHTYVYRKIDLVLYMHGVRWRDTAPCEAHVQVSSANAVYEVPHSSEALPTDQLRIQRKRELQVSLHPDCAVSIKCMKSIRDLYPVPYLIKKIDHLRTVRASLSS